MPAPSNNQLFDVQAYIADDALPLLVNQLTITRTFDHKYAGWKKVEDDGTRGDTFDFKKPTRLSSSNSLAFDAVNSGSFSEERMTITADQEKSVNYAVTDQQLATFDNDDLLRTNGDAAISEIATEVDSFSGELAAFGGYRFVGNPNVQAGQMQTVGEVTNAMAKFRSFGGQSMAYYGFPNIEAAAIIQTAFQQFVQKRNEELALSGEIGYLQGVQSTIFYQSTVFPSHVSGTAANNTVNFSTGYTIDSVTPSTTDNTTVIALSGGTTGETILVNDVFDLGVLNTASPIHFLTYTGHVDSGLTVQGKVITGDTFDGSGEATITVQPRLVFDATDVDPARNLTRAIATGTDTVRFATSHRCGAIYLKDYIKFAAPQLPTTSPYNSGTERDPQSLISLRAYHGHIIGSAQAQFVHDIIYGGGTAEEGIVRVLYPFNVGT